MKKNIIAFILIAVIAVLIIKGVKIESVDDYYLSHIDDITSESETVFLTIRCDEILSNWDDLKTQLQSGGYVPEDGIILKKTEYVLRSGDTVYDIFDRAVRYNKIQTDVKKSVTGGIYVLSINNIYEYDCGALSGWMYSVNGVAADASSDSYALKDGDEIMWMYTVDMKI